MLEFIGELSAGFKAVFQNIVNVRSEFMWHKNMLRRSLAVGFTISVVVTSYMLAAQQPRYMCLYGLPASDRLDHSMLQYLLATQCNLYATFCIVLSDSCLTYRQGQG